MPLPSLANLDPLTAGKAVTDAVIGPPSTPTGSLTKVVMILLGLLFIAAGIFTFDKTKEVLVQGTKAAIAA